MVGYSFMSRWLSPWHLMVQGFARMLAYVVHEGQSYMQDFGIFIHCFISDCRLPAWPFSAIMFRPSCRCCNTFRPCSYSFLASGQSFILRCPCRCLTGPIPLVMDSCVMCQFVLWRRVNESNMNVISVPIMVLAMLSEAYGLHNFTAEWWNFWCCFFWQTAC